MNGFLTILEENISLAISIITLLSLTIPHVRRFFIWLFLKILNPLTLSNKKFQKEVLEYITEVKEKREEEYKESLQYRSDLETLIRQQGDDILEIKNIATEAMNISKSNVKSLDDINYSLYNNNKNGLVQQIAKIVSRERVEFALSNTPKFICDMNGVNIEVSAGYLRLVDLGSASELDGTQWMQVVYGELKDKYIQDFKRAATNKENFVGVVDFQNPLTGKHRGRWRIAAFCSTVGDATIYQGFFISPEDDRAVEIVSNESLEIGNITSYPSSIKPVP